MKITLRKAAALQHTINQALHQVINRAVPHIEIDIHQKFSDHEAAIAEARCIYLDHFRARSELLSALYEIRSGVAECNNIANDNNNTINSLLADLALSQKSLDIYSDVTHDIVIPLYLIKAKVQRKLAASDSDEHYSLRGGVRTPVLTKDDLDFIDNTVIQLKLKADSIKDELLSMNATLGFKLTNDAVLTLQKHGLIAK